MEVEDTVVTEVMAIITVAATEVMAAAMETHMDHTVAV